MIAQAAIALASGFFAGTSACSLPVYPILLNRLTLNQENPKWVTVFFTLGLGGAYFLAYMVLGVIFKVLGASAFESTENIRGNLTLIGALFAWFMAWRTLKGGGGINIKILDDKMSSGYLGALTSGAVYGGIITPCNTAFVVTGILPALTQQNPVEGTLLLGLFTVASVIPLLLLGFISSYTLNTIAWFKSNKKLVETLSALFLIIAGAWFFHLFLLSAGVGFLN